MYKAIVTTISSIALAGFFLLGVGGLASAQTNMSNTPTATHTKHHHRASATGCLQKGDEAGEYSIKASNGKMYGLTSTKVQLADHVGEKVKVRGYITPESAEGSEANEGSTGTEKGGDIDMTVTSLKMVSKSCNTM
jgi:hypothetical protein